MALVADYNVELYQVDLKTAFLNGEIFEEFYMTQLEGFYKKEKIIWFLKLNRSLHDLK